MDYPNRGTLWTNKYKDKDTKPDMTGDIKIELELLKDLIHVADSDHVVIKLDAWLGKHTDGNRKVSLKVNTYNKEAVAKASMKDPWDD
jgi:hypothetical protein